MKAKKEFKQTNELKKLTKEEMSITLGGKQKRFKLVNGQIIIIYV